MQKNFPYNFVIKSEFNLDVEIVMHWKNICRYENRKLPGAFPKLVHDNAIQKCLSDIFPINKRYHIFN